MKRNLKKETELASTKTISKYYLKTFILSLLNQTLDDENIDSDRDELEEL